MKKWILSLIFLFSAVKSWAVDSQACRRVENGQHVVNNINSRSAISTVTYEDAQRLFRKLEDPRYKIPYLSARDHCDARAHIISYILSKEDQLSTVKVFLEAVNEEFQGAGAPSWTRNQFSTADNRVTLGAQDRTGQHQTWSYHTAPALCVRKNGKDELYIFDPSLFSGPVPYTQWREKLAGGLSSDQVKSYTTSMYNSGPTYEHGRRPPNDFSTEELRRMHTTFNTEWSQHLRELYRLQGVSRTSRQSQWGTR